MLIGLTVLCAVLFAIMGAFMRIDPANEASSFQLMVLVMLPVFAPLGLMMVLSLAMRVGQWWKQSSKRDR